MDCFLDSAPLSLSEKAQLMGKTLDNLWLVSAPFPALNNLVGMRRFTKHLIIDAGLIECYLTLLESSFCRHSNRCLESGAAGQI